MEKLPRIAILMDHNRAYERDLIRGIMHYSNIIRPWLVFQTTPFYVSQSKESLIDRLIRWKPDGLIIRENYFSEKLLKLGVPIVYCPIETIREGVFNLLINDVNVGRMGAEYFINKGYYNLGFCGLDTFFWSEDRMKGFKQRVEEGEKNFFYYIHPRSKSSTLWENEPNKIAAWLTELPKPVAIMACTDECAVQIIEAAKIANILVPEEVSILGVDNDEYICTLTYPTISSIDINAMLSGYTSAKVLNDFMDEKKYSFNRLFTDPKGIVPRLSTDSMVWEDFAIAKALNYIYQNVKSRQVKVHEVADSVGLSTRSLEVKFKTHIKRTVFELITSSRIDIIKKQLVETNNNISEISYELGFSGVDSLSRFFKKYVSITPSEFRKKNSLL